MMKRFFYRKCKLDTNDKFGRYVVAAEDIKAGELLLTELPFVAGPYWDNKVNCLNCYAPSDTMCKKCKVVPLCWNCCNAHEPIECRTLNKFNLPVTFLIDNFDVVTPLRVLLQFYLYGEQRNNGIDNDADENKDRIDEMLNMESHCEKRRNSSIWQEYARNVIEPLRNVAKIDDIFQPLQLPWQLTDDFLQRIFGILDVNSFEVRTPNFEEFPVRGLYTQAALLAHECIGNTFVAVDNAKQLKVYSSVDIKAGQAIYNCYTAILYGTEARREYLMRGKYFECQCQRCLDPSELATHISSIKCRSCCIGYVIQIKRNTDWVCLNCNTHVPNETIKSMLYDMRQHIRNIGTSVDRMEFFLEKFSQMLHPNHYLLLDIKQKLSAVIRYMCEKHEPTTTGMPATTSTSDYFSNREVLMKRQVELCKEFVSLINILEPGISRMRGIALYEQMKPFTQLAKLYHQRLSIDNVEYLQLLCEAEALAKESIRLLLYEPPTNPEGMLARQAMYELKELRTIKARIEKTIKKSQSK